MKENSISYKTAKQETERLICEIEEITITHRAYTAECLRRVLKENKELNLKYYMLYTEKIENLKAQEVKIKSQVIPVQKVKDILEQKDKIIDLMADDIHGTQVECNRYFKDKEDVKQYFKNKAKELLNK